ncbi:MAG: class I SAM-dependent methyltransferase [Gemmatimonadales bacterium]|nr:class I SAM-dependent methyltransferase [Gemmatimonadales bacterium]
MLLEKNEVKNILCCPQTGDKLIKSGSKLVPEPNQDPNQEPIEYDIIDDYPVLIDFDRSVLEKENFRNVSSVVARHSYSGLSGVVKRLVSSPKNVTAENVEHIMNLLLRTKTRARVLIVGGGTIGQGMGPFYSDPRIELVSFDIYGAETVQFIADAHSIPLPANSFDAVIIQAVLEHVLEPNTVVSEIYRVLRSSGLVYSETPFLQHVHEGAYDFSRFTESGHRYLFKKFEMIKSGASAGAGTQLLWSLDNFFRGLFRSRKAGKAIKLLFFWLQHLDKAIPEPYNIDAASGVFFLGKKQMTPIDGKKIVAHYMGAQR